MLHKEIPFIRLVVPLCIGILTGYLSDIAIVPVLITAAIAIILLVVSLFSKRTRDDVIYGTVLNLILFSGGFMLLRAELAAPSKLTEGEAITLLCRVQSFPEKKPASYAVMTGLISAFDESGHSTSIKGNILLYITGPDTTSPPLLPGDLMLLHAQPVEFANRGNPFEFDYRSFMLKKGVRYYTFIRSSSVMEVWEPVRRRFREKALITGKRISGLYSELGLEEQNAALLSALTLGQKEMIDDNLRENFARAGVMHVMAVSGLHAGVVSMFVYGILFFLGGRLKTLRVVISIIVLWGFAFVTGLPPSVERASLMFTFLHAGRLLKRPANSINSILAAAFIMLVLKPSDITSLSFQLSFSAVIFISVFFRKAAGLLKTGFLPADKLVQLAIVSVLAQAGTLPFTLNAFGRFPVWFLPANIIIIPLASALIIGAFVMIICSPVPAAATLLAQLLNHLARLAIRLTSIIAGLPGQVTGMIVTPWPETVALLLFLSVLLHTLLIKKEKTLLIPMLALMPLMTISTARFLITYNSAEVVVYNTRAGVAAGFRYGNDMIVIADSAAGSDPVERHIASIPVRSEYIMLDSSAVSFSFIDRTFIIDSRTTLKSLNSYTSDFVIVNRLPRNFAYSTTSAGREIIVTSGHNNVLIPAEDDKNASATLIHYIQTDGSRMLKIPFPEPKKREKID
ncbi:MAG: ComEC/Rec2 family competence protein [Bacteroidales bacterium]